MRQEHVEAARHIEVNRRRELAQVLNRSVYGVWRGFAAVYIERAAVSQDHVEVVIAAERVAPREPIDDDGRLVVEKRPELRDLLLIGAQHALRIDDSFG